MLRTRLEEVILNIKLLQLGKVGPFLQRVPDSPEPKAVSLALQVSAILFQQETTGSGLTNNFSVIIAIERFG